MDMDGIRVSLELSDGGPLPLFAHPHHIAKQHQRNDDGKMTRAIICSPPRATFLVKIKTDENFRPFTSEGVKLTIACGHRQQEPGALDDMQAWFIYNEDFIGQSRDMDCYDIYGQEKGGPRKCVGAREFTMPAAEGESC